jgi:hypothetical protein
VVNPPMVAMIAVYVIVSTTNMSEKHGTHFTKVFGIRARRRHRRRTQGRQPFQLILDSVVWEHDKPAEGAECEQMRLYTNRSME